MKKLKNFAKNFINDEGGQGMAEYILLLVVVIGLVIAFKGKISTLMGEQMDKVSSGMGGITTQ
jgi:Flp pilus assembly pilin Flp